MTLPQVVLVLAAVLPRREFDTQLALDILAYHQQRNHAAYLSHRKRRSALVIQRE
ncbi:MAG: hypothetical protein HY023_05070 [Chloroflexi bacterium]|nr:hypothetical protein [Chloroflexota bacterium]